MRSAVAQRMCLIALGFRSGFDSIICATTDDTIGVAGGTWRTAEWPLGVPTAQIDSEMVRLTLETHAHEVAPGMWAAQASAEPLRRAVGDLVTLGEALGYTVQFPMPWSVDERTALTPAEIVWFAGGRPATRFLLQDGALLAAHLAPPLAVPHLLVIPSAAARLAALDAVDRADDDARLGEEGAAAVALGDLDGVARR